MTPLGTRVLRTLGASGLLSRRPDWDVDWVNNDVGYFAELPASTRLRADAGAEAPSGSAHRRTRRSDSDARTGR